MRQSCADTLATEEPDELIAHVRVCGGAGWVTIGSTRKPTPHSVRSCVAPALGRGSPRALLRHEVASFTARNRQGSCDLAWCGATCSRTVGASLATARYQAHGKAQH